MVRFSFRKKLLKGENVLSQATLPANAHGRLLGVLRYPEPHIDLYSIVKPKTLLSYFYANISVNVDWINMGS